jgi:hypothetical protein
MDICGFLIVRYMDFVALLHVPHPSSHCLKEQLYDARSILFNDSSVLDFGELASTWAKLARFNDAVVAAEKANELKLLQCILLWRCAFAVQSRAVTGAFAALSSTNTCRAHVPTTFPCPQPLLAKKTR